MSISPSAEEAALSSDPEGLPDRQFAAALAAYDEALAAGQPASLPQVLAALPAVEPRRLDEARTILHLLDQLHARSPSPRSADTDPHAGEPGDPRITRTRHPDSAGAKAILADTVPNVQVIAGRYVLERVLGHGGMGVVYLAHDRPLQRLVALKMIGALQRPSAENVQRFWAEAEAAGRLQHPNLVAVYDVGLHRATPADPPRPFLVMEYIAGDSLRDRLTGQPWPERPAAQLLVTLARAIHFAHQHHIIHRDLKPANILFAVGSGQWAVGSGQSPTGPQSVEGSGSVLPTAHCPLPTVPKITDFGVAKQLDSAAGLTRTGDLVGTPQYMAPEQAQGRSQNVGPATDVYALGVILYELLTGRPPFQGVMPLDIQLRVIGEEPLPPRRLQPRLPRDLETICLKCLEKEPGRRYATAEALADDLARFLAGQPIMARPISRWERLWKWARRQPAVAILLALVIVVTVLGVAGITWKWLDAEAAWTQADSQRQHAEAAETDALVRAGAETEAHRATQAAEAQARANALAEAQARRAVETEKERTEWALYGSRLSLAIYVWKDNDPHSTRLLLNSCPERFRHWEYAYLRRLANSNQTAWDSGLGRMAIDTLAVAPDGSRVAVASPRGYLQVLAADTGKPMWRKRFGKLLPSSVCFSPDSQRGAILMSIGADPEGQLCVWDAVDGHVLLTVPVKAAPGMVRFSPDGRRLIYGGAGTVHVLDLSNGKELLTLPGHAGSKVYVACSPDGQYLAAAGDQLIKVWDASTGQLVRTLEGGHTGGISGLAISPDSQHLATCGWEGTIRLWDLPAGQLRHELQGHTRVVQTVDFSPDSKRLVSCSWDRTVRLWEVATGQPLRTLRGHPVWVYGVAFLPDGQRVISGDLSGKLIVWDAGQDQESFSLRLYANSAGLSPDGRHLAAVNHEGAVLVDTQTGKTIWELPLPKARTVQYSPDGRWLLVGVEDQPLQRRDAANGQLLHTFDGDPSGVAACALDRKGQLVASIGGDQTLKVRDALTGRLLVQGEKLPDEFRAGPLCFSSDGRRLFLGSTRGRLQVRDAATGQLRQTLAGHSRAIHCLAASADGRYLASGSGDQTLKLWDAVTGQQRSTLRGHPSRVTAVTFSPDGERLVSGCYMRTLKIWNTVNGQELLPLPGHQAAVTSLSFSADGRWLLSSSEDHTVRLWDAGDQWAQVGEASR